MSLTFGCSLEDGNKIPDFEALDEISKIMRPFVLPSPNTSRLPPILCGFQFCPCHTIGASRLFPVQHIPSWILYLSYESLTQIAGKVSERIKNEPMDFVGIALKLECFRAIRNIPRSRKCKPERFLNKDGSVRDSPILSLTFDADKRICPGRHLVYSIIFGVTSSAFPVFNVTKAKDEDGNENPVKVRYLIFAESVSRSRFSLITASWRRIGFKTSRKVRVFHSSER